MIVATKTMENPKNQVVFPITRDDKYFIILFLVAIFGGAIRKWVVESSLLGNLVLLVQMLIPYAMFWLRPAKAQSPFSVYKALVLYFMYLLVQIISPLQVTLFHGILGLLVHGLFWIGIFYYLANRRLFHPARFIKPILVIVTLEIILAFVQYTLPPTHILNKYAHDSVAEVATIADSVRVSGTFSYLSGYTAFLLFFPFFVWGLILLRYPVWLVSLAVVFGGIAGFMTGSRSGMTLYVGFTGAILLDAYPLKTLGMVAFRLVIPLAVLVAFSLLFNNLPVIQKINKAYSNFAERVTQNRERGEESRRLTWDLKYFRYSERYQYPWTGIGTGATYQGAIILFGASRLAQQFGYVESEFVKVILEGGILLMILRIILATILVLNLSFTNKLIRLLIWFSLLYAAPNVFNVHNATFLFLGIMLADNIIWRIKQQAFSDREVQEVMKIVSGELPPESSARKSEEFQGYPQNVKLPS